MKLRLRLTMAAGWLLCTAIALGLAGCHTTPPPADTSKLADPAIVLLEPVRKLPDMPSCTGLEGEKKLACRAAYDANLRGQCVAYGERVIGWQQHWATVKGTASQKP